MNVEEAGSALVQRILTAGIDGLGPISSAHQVAEEHLAQHEDPEKAIDRLISTHTRVVGASGFATGVGGLLTLPVTIPADVALLYVYQGRMTAAIAHLRGYDLSTDEVRSVVLLSLIGAAGAEVAKNFGIQLANKTAMAGLRKVPGRVFIEINKKVGFRLITKAGQKGLINMTKLVPVAGGVAGAATNVVSTRGVAGWAKSNFPVN